MKILRVIESLDPKKGGPAYSVAASSRILVERGHEVDVVTCDALESAPRFSRGFTAICLGKTYGRWSFSWRMAIWLRANSRGYDLVVVHGIWQWTSIAYRIFGSKKPRLLVMPHGSLDVWDRSLRPFSMALKSTYWKIIERALYRRASAVLFTTDVELENSSMQFDLSGTRTKVIPYGPVDPGNYRLDEATSDLLTFGYLGRIHPKKGIDTLILAFSASHPDGEGKLLIAGSGDETYIRQLQSLAQASGVAERIVWLGHIEGTQKADFFRKIGLFVLPSHQENFGLAVAESLAYGTPVLISDQVNICGVVRRFNAGIVCSRDAEQFSISMKRWSNGHFIDINRRSARDCFEHNFSLESFTDALVSMATSDS